MCVHGGSGGCHALTVTAGVVDIDTAVLSMQLTVTAGVVVDIDCCCLLSVC